MKYKDELYDKCDELSLKYEQYDDILKISGNVGQINEFDDYFSNIEPKLTNIFEKEICISPFLLNNQEFITQKARQYNLTCDFIGEKRMIIKGEDLKEVGELLAFLIELEAKGESKKKDIEKLREEDQVINTQIGNSIITLMNLLTSSKSKLEEKIDFVLNKVRKDQEFIDKQVEILKEKIVSVEEKVRTDEGNNRETTLKEITHKIHTLDKKLESQSFYDLESSIQSRFNDMTNIFDEKYKALTECQSEEIKLETITKEIRISVSHRLCEKDIKEKASELELIIKFSPEFITVTGLLDNVNQLKIYLNDLKLTKKKQFFPKWWNFDEVRPFLLVEVPLNNEESLDVMNSFSKTLPNMTIVKLERIQINHLMHQHFTKLQQLQEKRPDMLIKRYTSYYGTGKVDPKTIILNRGTVFNIKHADDTTSGGYGKGFRFFGQAKNCHIKAAYKTENDTHQMISSSVFFGKSKALPPGDYLKALEEYDSIRGDDFLVIYEDSYSYPNYLIEYKDKRYSF